MYQAGWAAAISSVSATKQTASEQPKAGGIRLSFWRCYSGIATVAVIALAGVFAHQSFNSPTAEQNATAKSSELGPGDTQQKAVPFLVSTELNQRSRSMANIEQWLERELESHRIATVSVDVDEIAPSPQPLSLRQWHRHLRETLDGNQSIDPDHWFRISEEA
jgi:hypothetical protein